MKEDYVSCEQAVKLKECGFDWECDSYYYDDRLMHYDPQDRLNHNTNGWGRPRKCSAPTISFVQKWLREVKEIDVLVFNCACGYGWEVSKADPQSRGTTIALFDDQGEDIASGMWLSYEAALSAGIDVALNYIIDKNYSNLQ